MENLYKTRLKLIALSLMASTAIATTATALNLPDISPEQIAQDSQKTYNSTLQRTEVIAPSFDPFEATDGLAGTASLRSAGTATSIDGRPVSGGAFLDLSMIYTSASSDPYDTRGLTRAVFLSGQPVDAIRYDHRTLDCSENVREVVYDDGYYNGALSGYIGGVFRTYPRYRGHRGYGHRNYGYGHYGGYPYKYKKSKYKKHKTYKKYKKYHDDHGDYKYRHKDRDRDYDGRHRRTDRDDDSHRRKYKDRDRYKERHKDRDKDRYKDRDRDRYADRDRRHDRKHERKTDRSKELRPDHRTYEPRVRTDRRTPQMDFPPVQRRERVVKTSKPVVVSPPPPPPPPKVRAPKQVDRAVDRHFSKPKSVRESFRHKGRKQLNFFPMQFSTYSPRRDVYVTTRCAREETLSLHIPQERLDAARFDGMTVLLLDREDREIPVFIPPNYIEGFRQAVSKVSYPVRSLPAPPLYGEPTYGELRSREIPPPAYRDPPAEPLHGGGGRDPREPIIYGDPGSVTPVPQPTYKGYPQE